MVDDTPRDVSRRNFIKGVIAAGAVASSASYLFRTTTLSGQGATPGTPGTVDRLLTLHVNGQDRRVDVVPQETLAMTLRYKLGLTGTKLGCDRSECGACTVMIDGEVANSCLVAVGQVDGHDVTTIEGLAWGDILSDVQDALIKFGGTQCGICTPGIALCAARVLASEPDAPRPRLRELMSGNICRCTGYQLIVDAVAEVARGRKVQE